MVSLEKQTNLNVSQIRYGLNYQGKAFYNNLMQKWLDNILMCSTYIEGKSEVQKNFWVKSIED